MGIFDRLGSLINSYLNDFGDQTQRTFKSPNMKSGDPDFDAAYEELDDYLNKDARYEKGRASGGEKTNQYSWRGRETENDSRQSRINLPPEELRADYALLEVAFGADEETCKISYKKLLMIHHPDRHTANEGNYKKATEKTAKINAAYDRIESYWRLKAKK